VNIRALGLAGATVAMGIGLAAPARAITVELDFSVRSVSSIAAPEPATWSLMLIGFLGAGAVGARRRLGRAGV
jgi:hypothetical protein